MTYLIVLISSCFTMTVTAEPFAYFKEDTICTKPQIDASVTADPVYTDDAQCDEKNAGGRCPVSKDATCAQGLCLPKNGTTFTKKSGIHFADETVCWNPCNPAHTAEDYIALMKYKWEETQPKFEAYDPAFSEPNDRRQWESSSAGCDAGAGPAPEPAPGDEKKKPPTKSVGVGGDDHDDHDGHDHDEHGDHDGHDHGDKDDDEEAWEKCDKACQKQEKSTFEEFGKLGCDKYMPGDDDDDHDDHDGHDDGRRLSRLSRGLTSAPARALSASDCMVLVEQIKSCFAYTCPGEKNLVMFEMIEKEMTAQPDYVEKRASTVGPVGPGITPAPTEGPNAGTTDGANSSILSFSTILALLFLGIFQ